MFPVSSSSPEKRSHPQMGPIDYQTKNNALFPTVLHSPSRSRLSASIYCAEPRSRSLDQGERANKHDNPQNSLYPLLFFPPLPQQPRRPRPTFPNPVPQLRSPNIPGRCITLPAPLPLRASPAFQELEPLTPGAPQERGRRCTLLSQGASKACITGKAD